MAENPEPTIPVRTVFFFIVLSVRGGLQLAEGKSRKAVVYSRSVRAPSGGPSCRAGGALRSKAHPIFPRDEESRGAMGGLPALVGPTATAGIKGGQAAHGTLPGNPGLTISKGGRAAVRMRPGRCCSSSSTHGANGRMSQVPGREKTAFPEWVLPVAVVAILPKVHGA